MIIECSKCHKKYKYAISKFAGKMSKKVKCPSCSFVFTIINPELKTDIRESSDLSITTTRKLLDEADQVRDSFTQEFLKTKRISLAFLSGTKSGQIYQISQPVTTLGRVEGDVVIDDPECSRLHAQISITPEAITLEDLGSTNGTMKNGIKLTSAELKNQDEFTIGTTNIMLIISDNTGGI